MRKEGFLRNFVFGVEDSLVSTVGFVSGIAAAAVERDTILLSGFVLVVVEAFSMGVGSALSEESVEEARSRRTVKWGAAIAGGVVMFISYLITGLIVLLPYIVGGSTAQALPQSIGISLVMLFFLGMISARVARLPLFQRSVRMMFVGGCAIALGMAVGRFMP